ncbi:MAG: tyrosine-type recombinase/integrase [Calditrichaeota bacterium]|nr:tyrosine-type recombinase/integrase [Calditrichota bacterium]
MRKTRGITESLGIRIHRPLFGFRHGFGTRAVEAGLPLRWVSRYMGHSTITTTERWYDHSRLVAVDSPAQ